MGSILLGLHQKRKLRQHRQLTSGLDSSSSVLPPSGGCPGLLDGHAPRLYHWLALALHCHVRYAFGLNLAHEFLATAICSLTWDRLVWTWRLVVAASLVFNPDGLIVINFECLLDGL